MTIETAKTSKTSDRCLERPTLEVKGSWWNFRIKKLYFRFFNCRFLPKIFKSPSTVSSESEIIQDGTHLSILRAEISRNGGRRHGQRPIDRGHGCLRPSVGVQQHRGNDPPLRVVQKTNPVHQQVDQSRKNRTSRCHQVRMNHFLSLFFRPFYNCNLNYLVTDLLALGFTNV